MKRKKPWRFYCDLEKKNPVQLLTCNKPRVVKSVSTRKVKFSQDEKDAGGSDPVRRRGAERMTDRKEATAFLKEAVKIQRQVEKVEKERSLGAQCKRNGWTEGFVELEDHEKTRRYERDAEKIRLQKELTKIQNVVQKFQTQLIDVKPTPRLIQKLKEIMTEVEISIVSFKMDQRSCFEQLIKDEKIFFQEIAACEKKIENWSLGVNSDAKPTSAAAFKGSRPSNADHPPEVKALESFLLQTGGCHGGWDQDDHQIFLRVRTKHSARPAFKREAKLYLPGKSVEDVEQHEGWYLELVGLQDKKREAIQRWKNARQRERRGRLEGREEEKERKEEKTKVQAPQHRSEEGRKEAALQLEEWKEKKKRQEEQGEEQRRAEEVTEKRRAKEERRKQLDVKLTLEELLRLRREEEEEQEMKRREDQQREVEERRSEAAVGIKRSQERDFQKVEARLRERQLREQQEADRQKRIVAKTKEKAEGHVSRDPSRLIRATKGWEERTKHIGPSGGEPVLQMFHRSPPYPGFPNPFDNPKRKNG